MCDSPFDDEPVAPVLHAPSGVLLGLADIDDLDGIGEALGVVGRCSTHRADRGPNGDVVCDREDPGHRAGEGPTGEVHVETAHDDPAADVSLLVEVINQLEREKLRFVDHDDVSVSRNTFPNLHDGLYGEPHEAGTAVRRELFRVVAAVLPVLESDDALPGVHRRLRAADCLACFFAEHAAGDDLDASLTSRPKTSQIHECVSWVTAAF